MGITDRPADGSGEGAARPIPPGTFGFGFRPSVSRRALLAGSGALALSALLAACGGDDDDDAGGADTTSGGADTTASSDTTASTGTAAAPATSAGGATTDAPATDATAAAEAQTETVTIGLQSLQEQYVDPHFGVGGLIFPLTWAISDTLYRLDESAQYVPGLATEYEISDDSLTWTFTLREGVLMQDGSPFTAADVKTAVDRIVAGADFTHLATFKSYVTGATVVDDTHVQVMTNKPYATLVTDMPAPIPTAYYNEVGDAEFRKKPIAAGAWKFVSQSLNADVRYERFDDFWDDTRKPNFKNLVFQLVPDESSRVAGVQTGAIDIAVGMTAASVTQFEGDDKYKIVETKESGLAYLMAIDNVFPEEDSPLKNLGVRKALLMAIDREGIAASLYGGYAEVAKSPIPSVMLGYDDSAEPLPYDPDAARELLATAGFPDLSVTLNSYNATSTIPDIAKLAETVGSLWDQIGVTTTLNLADAGTILPAWRAKQLHGMGLIGGPVYFYYEPSRLTLSFFSTLAAYTTVSDPDLDALAAEINQEVDQDKREALGRQLSDLLTEQMWGSGMVTISSLAITNENIASWTTIKGCPYVSVAWLRAV
jgi:peptide/nickel transport system substrate-binding protein